MIWAGCERTVCRLDLPRRLTAGGRGRVDLGHTGKKGEWLRTGLVTSGPWAMQSEERLQRTGTGNLSKSTSNGGAGVRAWSQVQCPRPLPQAGHMPPASSLAFRTGCLPTPYNCQAPLHESATFCSVLVLRLSPFVLRRNCRSSSVSQKVPLHPSSQPCLNASHLHCECLWFSICYHP